MHWLAQAPSNIALIKYMGKKDAKANIPDNGSLSYTLPHLKSTVHLSLSKANQDNWLPLELPKCAPITLSLDAQNRFIRHLKRIKNHYQYDGFFTIQSNNNFPKGSGLASSASSFAALTKCGSEALSALTGKPQLSNDEQAGLSRLGSGSSCRSFYEPWGLWEDDCVKRIEFPYSNLKHQVVIISALEKKISSSSAHQLVTTSPHYQGRKERASERLQALIMSLNQKDWASTFRICWDEFQDMHQLFSTCQNPFNYITSKTTGVLNALKAFWDKHGDGPIVTMDAGPNIHLLYRDEQNTLAEQFFKDTLAGKFDVL